MSAQQTHEDVVAAGLSKTDQNINNTAEDIAHAARGHKANLSNPSTSPPSLFLGTIGSVADKCLAFVLMVGNRY